MMTNSERFKVSVEEAIKNAPDSKTADILKELIRPISPEKTV